MFSVFVKVLYFIIVSIISGLFYFSRLVKAKGRYVKKKKVMMCLCIFASHLPLLLSLDGITTMAYGIFQIIFEFVLIALLISESLSKKLMAYVEMNVILGISAITGYGLVLLLNVYNEALFYGMAMAVAVFLSNLRTTFSYKKDKGSNLSGREVTVCFGLVLLFTMYIIGVALYDVDSVAQIGVLYGIFAVLIFIVLIILYVNERIQRKEFKDMRYYVYSNVENTINSLEEQIKREEEVIAESYNWLVGNMEKIYSDMLKTVNMENADADVRKLPINHLIEAKIRIAENEGVVIKSNGPIDVPQNMAVYDMISIISNLLDNGIRAAKGLSAENREIKVETDIDDSKFYIKVSNMLSDGDEMLLQDDGNLKTTKKDSVNHGLGLKSVRNIALKYDLDMNISTDNGEFTVTITG